MRRGARDSKRGARSRVRRIGARPQRGAPPSAAPARMRAYLEDAAPRPKSSSCKLAWSCWFGPGRPIACSSPGPSCAPRRRRSGRRSLGSSEEKPRRHSGGGGGGGGGAEAAS
eukprot:scaffold4355_cov349-Prasinococcus_capsulatus_cf.AAC.3